MNGKNNLNSKAFASRSEFKESCSKTISSSVKSALIQKALNGDFIGAFPSYGYIRDPNNKNHLIIDEEAAEIVRRIFDEFLSGVGQNKIANGLNKDSVPCPSEYKQLKGINYCNSKTNETSGWTYSTIHSILKNKTLCGDLWQMQNRRGKFDQGCRRCDESEVIIVKDTHEAIISRKDFKLVQQRLKNNRGISNQLKHNVSIYAGHIRCECGYPMAKITNRYKDKTTIRYICRAYKTGAKTCTSHQIYENELNKAVLNFLNNYILNIPNKTQLIKKVARSKNISNDVCAKEQAFLSDFLIKQLLQNGKFEFLTKEIVDTFIDKIIVHKDLKKEVSLEIIPTFSNEIVK